MDFNTRHLRYFLTVAEEGSFTRAAVKLGVSQPALSQRIQALEKQIGFRLFVRSGRNAEMTSGGIALIEPIKGLISYSRRLDRLIRDRSSRQPRTLLIGATMYSATAERTALLADFHRAYPDQQLSMESGYTLGLYQSLLDCELDAAFVVGPVPDERFDWIALRWYEPEVIMSEACDLAGEEAVAMAMLRDRTVLSFQAKRYPDLYERLMAPLAACGAKIEFAPDQTPAGMLTQAAEEGSLVPVAFELVAREELARHGMVARPLTGLGRIGALMLVRGRGDNGVNDTLWRFASEAAASTVGIARPLT